MSARAMAGEVRSTCGRICAEFYAINYVIILLFFSFCTHMYVRLLPPPSAYFFLMLVFVLKKVNLYFIGVYVVCVRIKQDVINFGYIGLLEEDYEWITQQLVQVANRYIRLTAGYLRQ